MLNNKCSLFSLKFVCGYAWKRAEKQDDCCLHRFYPVSIGRKGVLSESVFNKDIYQMCVCVLVCVHVWALCVWALCVFVCVCMHTCVCVCVPSNRRIIRNNSIWDKLVFKSVQAALGGRVRLITTGSAPLSAKVLGFLRCIVGCPVSVSVLLEFCMCGRV